MENLRKIYDLNTEYILGANNNFLKRTKKSKLRKYRQKICQNRSKMTKMP